MKWSPYRKFWKVTSLLVFTLLRSPGYTVHRQWQCRSTYIVSKVFTLRSSGKSLAKPRELLFTFFKPHWSAPCWFNLLYEKNTIEYIDIENITNLYFNNKLFNTFDQSDVNILINNSIDFYSISLQYSIVIIFFFNTDYQILTLFIFTITTC